MQTISELLTYHLMHWTIPTADPRSVENMVGIIDREMPLVLGRIEAFRAEGTDRRAILESVVVRRRYMNYVAWAALVLDTHRYHTGASLARTIIAEDAERG